MPHHWTLPSAADWQVLQRLAMKPLHSDTATQDDQSVAHPCHLDHAVNVLSRGVQRSGEFPSPPCRTLCQPVVFNQLQGHLVFQFFYYEFSILYGLILIKLSFPFLS